jgi:hypothetical protein
MNLIERLLDEPFADDIHLVGTSQQTARVTHYANLTMAYIREQAGRVALFGAAHIENARIEAGVAMKAACVDALHTMARPAKTLKPIMRAIVTAIEALDTAAIVGDGDDRYNDAIESAIAAVRALPDAWMPIGQYTDEMSGKMVLIYSPTRIEPTLGYRAMSGGRFRWFEQYKPTPIDWQPTRFMPMPSPPEGE